MKNSKSKKKRVITVDQAHPLFPELDTLYLLNLKTLLRWKAERLFDLVFRMTDLLFALNKKFNDFPDYEEAHRFYRTLDESVKGKYIDFAVRACDEFKIITLDEFNAIVSRGRANINMPHLKNGFEFAQSVLKIKIDEGHALLLLSAACSVVSLLYRISKENLPDDMLKSFIAVDHLLTCRSHEAIGYWTSRLEGKKHGQMGGRVEKKLSGLVAAIKKFKEESGNKSIGQFMRFLSKEEYNSKKPFQVGQYDLYVDNGLIYHRDRLKKNKNGRSYLKWDRPIKIESLDRYFYVYAK